MIGVSYYKEENLIYLDIECGLGECFYTLGTGVLSVLNYNLTNLDKHILRYIKNRLSSKNSDYYFSLSFFNSLKDELKKFNPYFECVQKNEIKETVMNRFIRFLLDNSLFEGYSSNGIEINKENNIILPKLKLKDNPNTIMDSNYFLDCVEKIFVAYSGYLEDDVGEDFIKQINSNNEGFVPEIDIWALSYYKRYYNIHLKRGGFECLIPSSLEVRTYKLRELKTDIQEFISTVFSLKTDSSKAFSGSQISLDKFKTGYRKENSAINKFRNLTYTSFSDEDESAVEYEIESIYDLIYIEVLLMIENSVRIIKCSKCGNYIIYKQPKECNFCEIDFKRKIRREITIFSNKIISQCTVHFKMEKSARILYKDYLINIISKIEEYVLLNIFTKEQCKSILQNILKQFKKYTEGTITEDYFIDLFKKLNTDSYWKLASGDENAINSLLNLE